MHLPEPLEQLCPGGGVDSDSAHDEHLNSGKISQGENMEDLCYDSACMQLIYDVSGVQISCFLDN